MDGMAAALRNPPLADAIAAGLFGQVAMTLLHWSSRKSQKVVVDWRVLASQTDLEAFAHDTEHVKRQWQPCGTGLASAIVFSAALLATLPFLAARRLLDVSGYGADNAAGHACLARNAAVARCLPINGLPLVPR